MPGNSFIKFSDVDIGESMQEGHDGTKGWIEFGEWSWDIESETSFLKGGGAAVGKPTPGTFSFSHYFDVSSTVLLTKIVSGTHFKEVRIHMLKQTGDAGGKPQTFFEIVMTDAFVTKVATKAAEDGSLEQDVEMVCKEISLGYKAQLNDGALEKSAIPFDWNIAKMNQKPTVTSSF